MPLCLADVVDFALKSPQRSSRVAWIPVSANWFYDLGTSDISDVIQSNRAGFRDAGVSRLAK